MRLATGIKQLLGGQGLDKQYYRFLLMHTLFLVFTRIPLVFVNTLLFSETQRVAPVVLYNISIQVACAGGMLFTAQLVRRRGAKVTAMLGIVGYSLLFLGYMLFARRVAGAYVLFGLFTGLCDSLYYVSYGANVLSCTSLQNRDSGMGIISICASLVGLLVPFLSGGIISLVGGTRGYTTVFVLAFLVALLAVAAAKRLPAQTPQTQRERVDYIGVLQRVYSARPALYGLLGETCKGLREGTFLFALNLLLYQLIQNEFLVGFNTFLAGISGMLAFWLLSRNVNSGNRLRVMALAVVALLLAGLVPLVAVGPVIIILFAAANAFFSGLLEIPCYTNFFNTTQAQQSLQAYSYEILALHEIFVVAGRCAGLLLFLLFNHLYQSSIFAQLLCLFLLTATQLATLVCCRLSAE